jgi:hypothetical protein
MDIKVNLVELASELAVERVHDEFASQGESAIYVDNSDHIGYTEEAQSCFNMWYDYYYEFINKYKD